MSAKVLLVVGAGPALGYSLAERFGREGFAVALISRSSANLDALVSRLADHCVEAAGFPADVADEESLRSAITAAKVRFGTVDVLEYSPAPDHDTVLDALSITPQNARDHLGRSLVGAVTAAREVLPEMLERGSGAVLFTTGASATVPLPAHASVGLGMSALRNYATVLHAALAGTGVYAGTMMVATRIQKDTPGDPDRLADTYWNMYVKRDRVETIVGDLELLTRAGVSTG
ncbi:SDR family NAD(P)-dependent oxidoreductase [Mycobacterium sp. CVI_P3]|uniref:SDR family NAD(P)-dependent oxidoreductase n=1 Tax=Mycobacterium pinniadriaticum TaxID=2994102 RepID=A0ABT3SFK7_9MYCO|nr:SDR family NAD(P)-dependent oxidoreductase [Mycobacterium pinniadriaticum]MCX2931753.1 SDR family NAD(P)-dependent oxidoreductase [Mycobacterium pinniadriaticum]MCX2938172.1 SDR family NAD(P)-dependent oxidoreductase [Mycobacterium pinniadriaticum]